MRRIVLLALGAAAGFAVAVFGSGPARGDLLPTLPTLPITVTVPPVPPPVPPPPQLPPPPLPPAPPLPPPPALPPPPPVPPAVGAPAVPPAPVGPGSGSPSGSNPGAAPATGRASSAGSSSGARRVATTRSRFSASGPAARRGTVIRFRLRAPGTVELVVRAAGAGGCELIGRRQAPGHAGLNHVRFAGRVKGRPLAVGKYTITVVVVRGTHRTRVGTVAVEVVPPNRRLSPAQRTASVHAESCASAAGAPSAPASLLAAGAPLAGAGSGKSFGVSADPPSARAGGTSPLHGPAFKPPRLAAPATSGIGGISLAWLPFTVYALLGLIVVAALVQITRFFRGTWTP